MRALDGRRSDHSKTDIISTAKRHLRTHQLSESKAAIRAHQITYEALEILVSGDDIDRLPVEAWRQPTATWLPEDVPVPAAQTAGATLSQTDDD